MPFPTANSLRENNVDNFAISDGLHFVPRQSDRVSRYLEWILRGLKAERKSKQYLMRNYEGRTNDSQASYYI